MKLLKPDRAKLSIEKSSRERFDEFWPFIVQWEGSKYEWVAEDRGGPTKYGIDARSHPNVDIRNLTEEQAKFIYWKDYWEKNACASESYPLGEILFDICVNNGRGTANKLFGRLTFADKLSKASQLLDLRDQFYRDIVTNRPSQKKFLKGWLNRNNALRRKLNLSINN